MTEKTKTRIGKKEDNRSYEVPSIVQEVLSSSGQQLDPETISMMETKFGHDFEGVRIHTDSTASKSAEAINALAYTVGADIVLRSDHYAPGTTEGNRLLAHELTHVIQQEGMAKSQNLTIGVSGDEFEREAGEISDKITAIENHSLTAGKPSIGKNVSSPTSQTIQRVQREEAKTQDQATTATNTETSKGEDTTTKTTPSASDKSADIDGVPIKSYVDAGAWYKSRVLELLGPYSEIASGGEPVPASLMEAIETGKQNATTCDAGGNNPVDDVTLDEAKAWNRKYATAISEVEATKCEIAAKKLRDAERSYQDAVHKLESQVLPGMQDLQRQAFRNQNDEGLLSLADKAATILDTALITKDAILQIRAEAAEIETMKNLAAGVKTTPSANSKAPAIAAILENLNKGWAAFQLVRAAIDSVTAKKTGIESASSGVKAMSTVLSAGGTLLGASAGLTLYSNIYVGPLVDACISGITKLFDAISKGENKQAIETGQFDLVRWELEPGGRPVFDFMLAVMRADDAINIPSPVPQEVGKYFVDNESEFSAGAGKKEMPTSGVWLFKKVDESKIGNWLFRNRQNVWSMLYGSAKPPV